ncbi:type II secretion system F family protein [Castellaniella sp.]|uniref:type II secretion system F family protein n=1 Tax=Castellaniella sp. TaxID=1955812 RepID=UPI00355D3C8E
MTDTAIWLNASLILLILMGAGIYLYGRSNQRQRLRERAVAEIERRGAALDQRRGLAQVRSGSVGFLLHLGTMLPMLSATQRAESSTKLMAAGYRSSQAMFVLMGTIVLSVLGTMALTAWLAEPWLAERGAAAWLAALLVAAYLGSLLPRLVLDRLVSRRQEAIRLALPDALDLMVICTNAGLALNAALDRVADEMTEVSPELADELKLTATELKLSSDVERVLNGLANRTNIEGMRTLVSTFLQARQYGTAITQALRILARSERTARMMRLEEKAAKLSVKMSVPMMLFILPTVIIVGAGPAILNLMKFFASQ